VAGEQRVSGVVSDAAGRLRMGAAEEKALAATDPHVTHHDQIRFVLDAFGHEPCAARVGEVLHGAHGFELERIAGDAVNEESVDLHDVRLQAHPQIHAGVRGAVIVECELRALGAQRRDHRHKAGDVQNRALLGQLDHDPVRIDAAMAQQRERVVACFGQPADRARAEIEKQLAVDIELRERVDAGACGGLLELERAALGERLRKKCERRFERGAGRPANQTFVAEDRAAVEIDDRLEYGGQITPGDQLLDARRSGSGGRTRLHGS
jgi:hypothetical protein